MTGSGGTDLRLGPVVPPGSANRSSRDGWRDVVDGLAGAAIMAAALCTPFMRGARVHWGIGASEAARRFPGDELIPVPRWDWTHAIDVGAPAEAVWPWIAQIGADRGGFYSYQWLENLIGGQIQNAAVVHPDWAARGGGELRLHPQAPPLRITSVVPGRCLVAFMPPMSGANPERWMTASWLFLVEPLGPERCRVVSRYRCATSDDLASRLQFGPALVEPVGFTMDRRMLIGIKQRAERPGNGDEDVRDAGLPIPPEMPGIEAGTAKQPPASPGAATA